MSQLPFGFALPQVTWTPPKVSELPSWGDAKRVAIDVECRDEHLKRLGPGCRRDPRTNYVCGFGVAIEDGPEFYVSLKHDGGDNVSDPDAAVRYLRDQIRAFNGTIVNNGVGYDLDWIATTVNDDNILTKRVMDPQCLAVLCNELHMEYNLDALCERAGLPGKDETALRMAASAYRVDPKAGLWKLPARYVEAYGRTDARRALQVLRRLEEDAAKEGVGDIWALEQKVTPILVKMRRRRSRPKS